MNILIVDDEVLARERLKALMTDIDPQATLAEAANGLQALEACAEVTPDVVLLDIRMPGMDGIETAQHLGKLQPVPAIIFTTAYGDHALEAFDAQAIDYLLKPIREERLQQALEKARRFHGQDWETIADTSQPAQRSHFSAHSRNGLVLKPVEEVYYLQAEQKYVTAYWPGGELLLDETLKQLEQELGGRFIRIHRSTLVALDYIEALDRSTDCGLAIRLKHDAGQLLVSRRHSTAVKTAIEAFSRGAHPKG